MTGKAGGRGPVLLFGATGQIGWALSRCLRPIGNVVAVGRSDADLADAAAVAGCIRHHQPSLIINAAAYTDVDAAARNVDFAMAVNATAPGVMAEEAKRLGIPLVHYSTDYVFDGNPADGAGAGRRPYRESDTPAPLNVYGRSKLAGERAIQAVAPIHLILRTGWVYSQRRKNFFLTMRRLANDRDELRVVDDQIGSPTFAGSIAEATASIIGNPALQEASGCYHLSAAGATTWYGFATAILDAMSAMERTAAPRLIGIPSRDYPTPEMRPAYSVLDNKAVRDIFGISMPDWQCQLRCCLEEPVTTIPQ